MEKALEVLRELDGTDVLVLLELGLEHENIIEAIKELEEAKTCDGCIYEAEDIQDPHCAFCSRACRDNFEPKDTQC